LHTNATGQVSVYSNKNAAALIVKAVRIHTLPILIISRHAKKLNKMAHNEYITDQTVSGIVQENCSRNYECKRTQSQQRPLVLPIAPFLIIAVAHGNTSVLAHVESDNIPETSICGEVGLTQPVLVIFLPPVGATDDDLLPLDLCH
jgi:hypothetical protein